MGQYNPLEGLNLPQSQYLPQEYNQQMWEQMQLGQERAEQEQMRKYMEGINAMGRLYTGSALKGGIEQVLGPQMERQQQLLGDIGMRGMEFARGERITEQGQDWQSGQAQLSRDWQTQQAELDRQQRMAMFQKEIDSQKKSKNFFSQMGQYLPAVGANLIGGGVGSLLGGGASMLFGGGGGGLPSMPMGGGNPSQPTYMMRSAGNTQPRYPWQ